MTSRSVLRSIQGIYGRSRPFNGLPYKGRKAVPPFLPSSLSQSSFFSSSSTSSRPSAPQDVLGIAVFGTICAGAAYLSYWQLERYQWKKLIIKESRERLADDALPDQFPSQKISQNDLSYFADTKLGNKILIRGKFDHSKEILLGPRTAPSSASGGPAQGMATNPQGFYVITPFVREIDNNIMYVNRGWIPKNAIAWSRPEGSMDIAGVVGEGFIPSILYSLINLPSTSTLSVYKMFLLHYYEVEKKAAFTPTHSEQQIKDRKIMWLDENALLVASGYGEKFDEAEGIAPVVIIEEIYEGRQKPTNRELPLAKMCDDFINPSVTPETHLVYALTWASLAAIGSGMTFKKFNRGNRKKNYAAIHKAAKSASKI